MVPPGKKPAGETSNSNKKCKRYFNEHWKEEFTWLEFDYERKLMFCLECRQALVKNKHGKAENAFTVGTDNFQRHALLRHVTSGAHRQALAANREQPPAPRGRPVPRPLGRADVNPAKVAILSTVYWMAKEDVPLERVPSLLELQKFNLCQALLAPEHSDYFHAGSVREMQAAMARVLQREARRRIKASPFVGLLVEERADAAARGSLAVFGTTVSPRSGQPSAAFLGCFAPPALPEAMRSFGISAGKAAWLRAEGPPGAPCPRLAEARGLPAALPPRRAAHVEYVPQYESALDAVFRLYGRPAVGAPGPRELREALELCGLPGEGPGAVRWAAVLPAVEALDAAWPALVPLLERDAARSALALGLCRELKTFQFVAFTKTLLDALPVFRELRGFFQGEDSDLSALEPAVTAAAAALQAQRSAAGRHLRALLSAAAERAPGESRLRYRGVQLRDCSPAHVERFERLKESYLESARCSLLESFPGSLLETLSSFSALFNPGCYPRAPEELGGYGVAELDLLLRTFSRAVQGERARGDFPLFKRVVLGLGQLSLRELCAKLVDGSSEMHELFPDFAVLAAAALALPLGSALARKLSRGRELLARGRSRRAGDEALSDLVKIAVDGPPVGEFDFALAVEYYESMRESGLLVAHAK
ncbi:uncharacterized protein C17orf113 homolog [Eudromia elegans]